MIYLYTYLCIYSAAAMQKCSAEWMFGCCIQRGAFTSVRLTLESAEIAGELHGTDVILLSKLDPMTVSPFCFSPSSNVVAQHGIREDVSPLIEMIMMMMRQHST